MKLFHHHQVRYAIQRLKNNKSAGPDGIPAELLKAACINFCDAFHQLLVKIWNAQRMPNDWNQSIISPIHKKGDKKEYKNYLGVRLLNIAYKILASILCERSSKSLVPTNVVLCLIDQQPIRYSH